MAKIKAFPFFFSMTSLVATLVPMYFICIILNDYVYPGHLISEFSWHGHEMLFGLTSALLAGFLLTASANWTNSTVITKKGLWFFGFIWVASRIILFIQPNAVSLYFASSLFFLLLLIKLFIVLKATRNRLPISLILSVLFGSSLLNMHGNLSGNLNYIEYSYLLASASIFSVLFIFSGRLIPFFTNSKFDISLKGLSSKIDILTLFLALMTFFLDFLPLIVIVVVLMIYRASCLFDKSVIKEPMLLILHVAHFWFVLFFIVKLLLIINPSLDISRAALHALFAGALGNFALAMMSRVSLGHSGRAIKASKSLVFSFVSLNIGAILRVFMPIVIGDGINNWLHISMGFWTLGFIIFLFSFMPIYLNQKKPE